MSNDRDYIERTTITEVPVRREANAAGWWVAALVAIVAIAGLVFMFVSNNPTQSDLQAARDQGVAEATVANATVNAQAAAAQASQAAQSAVETTARASEQAANRASEAAQSAAASTAEAAQDATTTEPAPQ
jgi:glucan phosphoethanolaminetransferase (alkaline phosphatase superfamily)